MARLYRLRGGMHCEETDANGTQVTYSKGQKFISKHDDLVERFGRDKFEDLGPADADTVVATSQEEEPADNGIDFDQMTVAELRNYAEDNEIDLEGATRKDDIILAIKVAEGIE